MHDRIPGITAGEQHFQGRPPTDRLIRELTAIHTSGQAYIREEQRNISVRIKQTKARTAIRGVKDPVTKISQHFDHESAHILLVFHHEN
jgi:hypothetical protein